MTAVGAHELLTTRLCVTAGCTNDAVAGLEHCRRHASVADLRQQREAYERETVADAANGHTAAVRQETGAKPRGYWTRERIITAYLASVARGVEPGWSTWERAGDDHPAAVSAMKRFGSFDALRAAAEAAGQGSGREPTEPEEQSAPPVPSEARHLAHSAVLEASPGPELAEPGSRPDEPSADLAVPESEFYSKSEAPALTGDFAHDAQRVRAEALRLREHAAALDVIATGIEMLAETVE